MFRRMSRAAARRTITATNERSDRVGVRMSRTREDQADEHGDRPDQVAREVERVRLQRGTRVAAGRAPRDDRPRRGRSGSRRRRRRTRTRSGSTSDELEPVSRVTARHAITPVATTSDRRLGQRGEVLRLPVAVVVATVRRPHGVADGEEREQCGDEVGARMRRLGDQTQAWVSEAGGQLERDERGRSPDGDERQCAAAGSLRTGETAGFPRVPPSLSHRVEGGPSYARA